MHVNNSLPPNTQFVEESVDIFLTEVECGVIRGFQFREFRCSSCSNGVDEKTLAFGLWLRLVLGLMRTFEIEGIEYLELDGSHNASGTRGDGWLLTEEGQQCRYETS